MPSRALQSLYFSAILSRDVVRLEELLQSGTDVNICDGRGCSAMHYAALSDNNELINFFVSHGATLETSNRDGATPLFVAAQHGKSNATRTLCRLGANPNSVDRIGRTPLMVGAYDKKTPEEISLVIVELLLDSGAEVNMVTASHNMTALHFAFASDRHDIAAKLISAGADQTIKDYVGRTPNDRRINGHVIARTNNVISDRPLR